MRLEEAACLADSRTRTTLGKTEQRSNSVGGEGEEEKNLDFLQFEGACPRNYKPENKKTLLIYFKCLFQSICHHNSPNIFTLNCIAFSWRLDV